TEVAGAESDNELEGFYGLTDDLVRDIKLAAQEERREDIPALVADLHAADLADLLEHLGSADRGAVIETIGSRLDAEVVSYLDVTVREDVLGLMNTGQLAAVITELESDDAVDLIEDLDEAGQKELLEAIPDSERLLYEEALAWPEDSAGRLMRREVVAVSAVWTVGETIDFMRSDTELPDDFYYLTVVDTAKMPLGMLSLSRMLRTKRPVLVTEIMDDEFRPIPVTMDQEDVAFLFRQYGLVEAPVVDETGRLVGVITVDDVVNVIEEEHEEDMMRLAGMGEDDYYSAVIATTRSRFSWLLLNLATAILASFVIAMFDAAIEKVVALAILMPIVASMGGNAGTQTLTVTVRALATRELTTSRALRAVVKESLVGFINGVLFAIVMGIVGGMWFDSVAIGGVLAAAMMLNLLVAGLVGTLIPLALDHWGADPAVASAVFLTTVTDVVGFFCFLGLGAWVLL
ncbi:MAG: magnesium transporter, partial [Alphaproteobacteria bacterium]|nr:magnesium transporter [Alphaproteobacteria bacterium]